MLRRSMTRLGYIATTALALLLLAGCGRADGLSGQTSVTSPAEPGAGATASPESGGVAAGPLEGTKWTLASYGPAASPTAVPNNAGVTAEFTGGTLGGSAGCNSYSAFYTLNGSALTVGSVMQTEMACLDEAAMARERDFVTALQTAQSLAVSGDALTIGYAGGELRFTKLQPPADQPLEGTAWQLTTVASGEVASSLIANTQITAEFTNGTLAGKSGCNSYSASYSLSGPGITVGEVVSTKIACASDIMTQEQVYLAALGAATGFAIEGEQLTLTHPGGHLIFRATRQ
jgi:heat shock protein HslJ